ncbi:MAG TPA: response regulator [Ktedonosporobacter sp.]|nr:response regulator [Ktedonosporobacter sp.]
MQKKKILIIDDDPDILFSLQILLEDVGYAVETSDNDDGLRGPHDALPHLILLDLLLSGRDGSEITRQLKSQEQTRHIPIIMFSAHPSAGKLVLAAGADDFLPKPFERAELLARIACYI